MRTDQKERPLAPEIAGPEELVRLQAAALEAAANPVLISNREGKIVWANRAFEQLSGYKRSEVLGQSTRLLKSGQESPELYKNLWDTILAGQEWRGELVNRRKDGAFYPESMTITPVRNEAGDIAHFIAIKLDITERKRAEERISRLAQVVENSAELIAIADTDGRISFANQALLRATGYLETELVGEFFGTPLLSQNNPPGLVEEIHVRTVSGDVWRGKCNINRKDGSDFPVFLSTGQIKDSQGRVIGIFGISQDLTERKQLEEQFRVAQKMEAVGRLAGGVAHDFNNLLGVIIGYSDLLLDRVSPDDPDHHHVQEIKKAGSRAASLTRQLLAFSRKQVFQPKVLDLNAVVADLNKLLHRLIGEDIELVTALRPTLGTIKMDPGQLEQVLMNLVVNARDAMPKGGKLTIATANVDVDESYCRSHPAIQVGPHVVLAVSDTGIGMDAETQARIFEPFFTTKELGKGTGLGLSTVYGVVKQSEGYIWVYSEPGIGTTFKIYFPRVDEPVDVIGIGRPNSAQLRGTETILIAEDAEPLRKLTCTFLKSNGYRVLAAGSGAEAIKMAAEYLEPIHLLLTDVVMPRMSGPELANRLTAARPEMRVVYMSGYTDDAIVHYGVLEPGTFFIEKPFSREVLLGKVRDALDQARAAPVISLEQPLSRA